MAYNPDTGYVYIPALDMAFPYGQAPDFEYLPGHFNTGIDIVPLLPPKTVDGQVEMLQSMKGHLAAWDPVAQREVWRVQHPTTWNGGLLSTAGNLVFQGRSDGYFAAYAADSGALLWETPVHTGIIAAPVAYTVDGEQYIAVVAGWGRPPSPCFSGVPRHKGNVLTEGRILAFKLGGTAELPHPDVTHVNIPEPPAIDATPEVVARGELLYHTWCSSCHGAGVTSGSALPDLKYLSADAHARWDLIVREGRLCICRHAPLRPRVERSGFASGASVRREPDPGRHRVLRVGVSRCLPGNCFRHGRARSGLLHRSRRTTWSPRASDAGCKPAARAPRIGCVGTLEYGSIEELKGLEQFTKPPMSAGGPARRAGARVWRRRLFAASVVAGVSTSCAAAAAAAGDFLCQDRTRLR